MKVTPSIPQRKTREKKIPIVHPATRKQNKIFFGSLACLFILALLLIDIDYSGISAGLERLPNILSEFMNISFKDAIPLLQSMVTTLAIAFLAVLLSFPLALILAFLVAKNTTPHIIVSHFFRYFLMSIRSIPTTIWVLIAVVAVGFGEMAGIIGLMFPTVAFLVKAISAQIEEEGEEIIEAIKSVGGSWIHIIFKGVIPVIFTGMIATLAVRFELDVHESVILGVVGAGGIGYLLQNYIKYYRFSDLALGIIIVFLVIFTIEMLIGMYRKKVKQRGS